jgi:hypothetical protein
MVGSLIACGFVTVVAAADSPQPDATRPGGGRIVFETGAPPPVPVFFSVTVEHTVRVTPAELTSEAALQVVVLQGRPETLVVGIEGEGEVMAVGGSALRDWSIRQRGTGSSASRWLVLRPVLPEKGDGPRSFGLQGAAPSGCASVCPAAGGFPWWLPAKRLDLSPDAASRPMRTCDVRLACLAGASALARGRRLAGISLCATARCPYRNSSDRSWRIDPRGELMETHVSGVLESGRGGVHLRLRGVAQAKQPGARLRLLSGGAALARRRFG